jgi:hypothetical protein
MRCENCHGWGYKYFASDPCPECNGCGIASCCDTAGSNYGETMVKKIGDYVSKLVRKQGNYISETDKYIFAHNVDAYLIWHRETGKIVWVGEEGKLGADGYDKAWDKALELNETNAEPDVAHVVIACTRVHEEGPRVPSRIASCSKCKKLVYVANTTPNQSISILLCMQCINWEEVTQIEKPTMEQLEDIFQSKLGG